MIGFGTFRIRGIQAQSAIERALKLGYLKIDTASCYRNEFDIRVAIQKSGVPRNSIFITSKVQPKEMISFEKTYNAVVGILDKLGTSYLDLCLLHWPGVAKIPVSSPEHQQKRIQAWAALERIYTEGKARLIGVSNFEESHLRELMRHSKFAPAVNQVECHPLFQQRSLRNFCSDNKILVEAYASFGEGNLLRDERILKIANECNMSAAQLLLCWSYSQGIPMLPKSTNPDHIASNLRAVKKFKQLKQSALDRLKMLDCGKKFAWDPRKIR